MSPRPSLEKKQGTARPNTRTGGFTTLEARFDLLELGNHLFA